MMNREIMILSCWRLIFKAVKMVWGSCLTPCQEALYFNLGCEH
jgi:hypothetical protein